MTDNEREEWVYDLATQWVNRLSDAGVWALAVDQAFTQLWPQTDEELKKRETPPKKERMHGFKKKEKPFGFS